MVDLVNWDPYRELRSLQERFNRTLSAGVRRDREEEMSLGSWIPPVDIAEESDRILLMAELPGFQENEIEIQMEGNVLTLRGERKFEDEKQDRNYHRVERSYGQFVRSFTLPGNVDRESIKASFREGVLQIELPKREEAKPRQIRITGNGGEKQGTREKKGTIEVQSKS